jgi:hypothetical protein
MSACCAYAAVVIPAVANDASNTPPADILDSFIVSSPSVMSYVGLVSNCSDFSIRTNDEITRAAAAAGHNLLASN